MNAHRIVAEYEDGSKETVGWCDVMCTMPLVPLGVPVDLDAIRNAFVSEIIIGRKGHWPYHKARWDSLVDGAYETVDPQGRKVRLHVKESMSDIAKEAWRGVGAPTEGLSIFVKIDPRGESCLTVTERTVPDSL